MVWETKVTSPMLVGAACVMGAVAVGLGAWALQASGAEGVVAVPVLAAGALFTLACGRVTVSVDDEKFRVRSSVFGFALKTVRIRDIRAHRVESQGVLAWGGWGYRWMPGRSAVVLRSGPGLTLELASGRLFSVTLPDADEAGAVLARVRGG